MRTSLRLLRAVSFAEKAHRGINRKYTLKDPVPTPYLVHLLEVATLIADAGGSEDEVIAGLLHDTLEDTKVEREDIMREFGENVARMVMEATEISTKADGNREARKAKDREHYGSASPGGKTVKLADMLSNGHDIEAKDPHFAVRYMREMRELHPLLLTGNVNLYRSAAAMLTSYFAKHPARMKLNPCMPPSGLFEGTNILTPRIKGYYRLAEGYAELSEGEGMSRQPIFGVTVRPDPNPRRSKLCHSLKEAEDYIKEMS